MPSLNFIQGAISALGETIGNPAQPSIPITYLDPQSQTTVSTLTPLFSEGQLIFGLLPNNNGEGETLGSKTYYPGPHRAYIYLDHESGEAQRRFVISGPIDVTLSLDQQKKELLLKDIQGTQVAQSILPFLYSDGNETKTGTLTMSGVNSSLIMQGEETGSAPALIFQQSEQSTDKVIIALEHEHQQMIIGAESGLCTIDYEGNISAANNLSLKGDKATLSYNDITQSLDFTFN